MAGVLVDSNVLLDLFTDDPVRAAWSQDCLAEALERALPDRLDREALPYEAAFLAGKCFLEYRRRGAARRSPLPDFYIGAHAAVTGRSLLTRDAGRHRSLLPVSR